MQINGIELTPFVLGAPGVAPLPLPSDVPGLVTLDVLAPESRAFGRLLNAGNALAFDSIGMPLWVQLDCATVPSAFHGFAASREALPDPLWARLVETHARVVPDPGADRLAEYVGLVPVSGFCALRTSDPDTISAISLFSVLRGHGLGVRTKALGLAGHGAARQVGVTQYDNAAVRAHAAFGELELLATRAHGHTYASRSFVYALTVPGADVLAALREGHVERAAVPDGARLEAVDAEIGPRLEARLETEGAVRILPPGQARCERGLALVTA